MTLVRTPSATAFFNAFKNMVLSHFLSAGRLACMCFLMAMDEEPLRSLRASMALMISALYDMVTTGGVLAVLNLPMTSDEMGGVVVETNR